MIIRVFVVKKFDKLARKSRLSDLELIKAVLLAEKGLGAVDLGEGLKKVRIARENRGKSAGFRALLVIRVGMHAFYIHAFAKNDQANLTSRELEAVNKIAGQLLTWEARQIEIALQEGALRELTIEETGDE